MGVTTFFSALHAVRRLWHLLAKISAFFLFGIGGIALAVLIFPALSVLVHPKARFQRVMRTTVCMAFRAHVWYMRLTGLISLRIENRGVLARSRGMIVAANHPSLIDVVILIAYIPGADCIVKARLWSNFFVRGVVSSLYIPNSLDFEQTAILAKQSLEKGHNLIIFPEGTRTNDGSPASLRRGCAHIALSSGSDVLPIRIMADEPAGLQKGDSIFRSPKTGVVRYRLTVMDPIFTAEYREIDRVHGSRLLTSEIKKRILH